MGSVALSQVANEKEVVMGVKKSLSEMTLEELWQLFPIELVGHRDEWRSWAADEIAFLSEALAGTSPVINHIGSTAIPGIMAKPIIDILIEVGDGSSWAEIRRMIEACGYICMAANGRRMSFNKGYTPAGYAEKVFHVHVHPAGDNDEVYFRDYLTAHPDMARAYEALKQSLLPRYRHDRDGYTAAKSEFVGRVTAIARADGSR